MKNAQLAKSIENVKIEANQNNDDEESDYDSDDENDIQDGAKSKNFLSKSIILFRTATLGLLKQVNLLLCLTIYLINKYSFKPLAPKILLGLFLVGFIIYFAFSIRHQNPFYFTKITNSSNILRDYVFAANQSNTS